MPTVMQLRPLILMIGGPHLEQLSSLVQTEFPGGPRCRLLSQDPALRLNIEA